MPSPLIESANEDLQARRVLHTGLHHSAHGFLPYELCLVHSTSGALVAAWGPNQSLTLSESRSGRLNIDFAQSIPQQANILTVAFSADDRFFTVVLDDLTTFAWDLKSQSLVSCPRKVIDDEVLAS